MFLFFHAQGVLSSNFAWSVFHASSVSWYVDITPKIYQVNDKWDSSIHLFVSLKEIPVERNMWSRTTDPQRGNTLHCTARPKIQSQSQIFRYGQSKFCLPHRPNFSDIFDLCLHWVSVVRLWKRGNLIFKNVFLVCKLIHMSKNRKVSIFSKYLCVV